MTEIDQESVQVLLDEAQEIGLNQNEAAALTDRARDQYNKLVDHIIDRIRELRDIEKDARRMAVKPQ